MTTKFSSILKVKNLDVEKLENQIVKLNNQKKSLHEEIRLLHEELTNSKIPDSGNISQLKIRYFQNDYINQNINLKLQNIKFLEEQIQSTELLLKKAMLEYEKINHLNDLEIKEIVEKLKKQEAKDLDEIGTLLFSLNKEDK